MSADRNYLKNSATDVAALRRGLFGIFKVISIGLNCRLPGLFERLHKMSGKF